MDEYINRDTALQYLAEGGYWEPEDLEVAQFIIGQVPAADVEEVRHGEWEYLGYAIWICTACREHFFLDDYGDEHPKADLGMNYCPNCGAKMDGGGGST